MMVTKKKLEWVGTMALNAETKEKMTVALNAKQNSGFERQN